MNLATQLARLDAVAQAELCESGEVTPEELFDAALERLDAVDPALHAVVTVQREFVPPPAGPLQGVPFLAKDSLPWPGLRWSLGSRLFAAQTTLQQTAYGRRLGAAGLVCVGKSAMSEFGLLASTESLLEGPTHNPWDLARSAGGSSGGAAAAVAAGIVPVAHVSDGGGSARIPASMCGVFGFKPTRGRTAPSSLATNDFLEMTADHCVSRSVRDSALWLSLTEDAEEEPIGFVREPLHRKRLRVATWTGTLVGEAPTPGVRRAHEEAIALLTAMGHDVEEVPAPVYETQALTEAFFLVAGAAVAGFVDLAERTREHRIPRDALEPFTWEVVERFRAAGGDEALPRARAAFARAAKTYAAAAGSRDVVLTPTLAQEPPPLGFLSPELGYEELLHRTARVNGYAPILNVTGGPAMSVPLATSREGLPIGMHLAAAPGADALLLALAYQLEEASPWADRWPPSALPQLER